MAEQREKFEEKVEDDRPFMWFKEVLVR
jgi:hypothetical protein